MNFEQNVKNGAMLLDAHVPGWRDKINIEKLDILDCRKCILGQIFGDYNVGTHLLGLDSLSVSIEEYFSYGFSLWRENASAYYFNELTLAWKEYLIKSQQFEHIAKKELVNA